MSERVIFDKMGLRITPEALCFEGRSVSLDSVTSFYLRKERDRTEHGLMVSVTVFGCLGLLFLIPIIEELIRIKYLWVVAVAVLLTSVSLQDYFKIRNPGDTFVFIRTKHGVSRTMRTASPTVLSEVRYALESVGVKYRPHTDNNSHG
ncbi:MAG: hypothetical protein AAFZ01_08655 [Pseudomonadota bacterium]